MLHAFSNHPLRSFSDVLDKIFRKKFEHIPPDIDGRRAILGFPQKDPALVGTEKQLQRIGIVSKAFVKYRVGLGIGSR